MPKSRTKPTLIFFNYPSNRHQMLNGDSSPIPPPTNSHLSQQNSDSAPSKPLTPPPTQSSISSLPDQRKRKLSPVNTTRGDDKRAKFTVSNAATEFAFLSPSSGEDLLTTAATSACRMLLKWTDSNEAKTETKSREAASAEAAASGGSSKVQPVRRALAPSTPESMLNMIQSRLQLELKQLEQSAPVHVHWSPKDAAKQMKFFEDEEVVQREDAALVREVSWWVGGGMQGRNLPSLTPVDRST
jgi:hypothetical protein